MTLEADVAKVLGDFWDENTLSSPETGNSPGSVADLVEPFDSMSAVDALLTLQKSLGVPLPDSLVRRGGYQSKNDFVDHLGAQVVRYITKGGQK